MAIDLGCTMQELVDAVNDASAAPSNMVTTDTAQTIKAAKTFSKEVAFDNQIRANGSVGTAGQVLTSQGAGKVPVWKTPSSGSEAYKMVTYAELRTLRANSNLVKGMQYRITDYTCTTTQDETQSAGHVFDIIVTADDVNVLNENARAARHSGDSYFEEARIGAWEIKYTLDNNSEIYAWADTSNGKGVIYYMKDEFGNECPYDFKNIQFKRYKLGQQQDQNFVNLEELYLGLRSDCRHQDIAVLDDDSEWCYTFTWYDDSSTTPVVYDASVWLNGGGKMHNDESFAEGVHSNIIKPCTAYDMYIDSRLEAYFALNNIVIMSSYNYEQSMFYGMYGNTFPEGCHDISAFEARSNHFRDNSSMITLYDSHSNTIGIYDLVLINSNNNLMMHGVQSVVMVNSDGNNIGNSTANIYLYESSYNIFGTCCCYIQLHQCSYNNFGNVVRYFYAMSGARLYYSTIGNYVQCVRVGYGNVTACYVYNINIENMVSGYNSSTPLDIYDTSIINKKYPITITKDTSSYGWIMKWHSSKLTMAGKYKANLTSSWTTIS